MNNLNLINAFNPKDRLLSDTFIDNKGNYIYRKGFTTTNRLLNVSSDEVYYATGSYWASQYDQSGKLLDKRWIKFREPLIIMNTAKFLSVSVKTSSVSRFMIAKSLVPINYSNDYVSFCKSHQEDSGVVDTDEADSTFIKAMNQKCELLGLNDTVFVNSHGLFDSRQLTTSRDLSKLLHYAAGSSEILKVWGARSFVVHIRGDNARSIPIQSTVSNMNFENEYSILGGKTGTLVPNIYNLAMLVGDKENNVYAVTVLKSSNSNQRFLDAKILLDIARNRSKKSESILTYKDLEAISGEVIQIKNNPLFWTNSSFEKLISFNSEKRVSPASLTKLMTAILLTESISNMQEKFKIIESDIVKGSGPRFFDGDILSFNEALFLMLLPSSNTVAKAVSRIIGKKLSSELVIK